MADDISVIEGEFCRVHLEDHLWQLRSINGLWQGYNCPKEDIKQAGRLVREYDERTRKRLTAEESRLGRTLTNEEIGRNPDWIIGETTSEKLFHRDNEGKIWRYYAKHDRYYPFVPCDVGNPRFGAVGMECELDEQQPCVSCKMMCCKSCKQHVLVPPPYTIKDSVAEYAYNLFGRKEGWVCVFCWRGAMPF